MRALSLCTCCRHYPGTATGGTALLVRPVMSAFPERVAGSACASSFSRLTQRSLALRPAHSRCHQFVARLTEGFRHIVTSMSAPVASGWSGCRVGLAPTGKRRLCTAHTHCSHSTQRSGEQQCSGGSRSLRRGGGRQSAMSSHWPMAACGQCRANPSRRMGIRGSRTRRGSRRIGDLLWRQRSSHRKDGAHYRARRVLWSN